MQGSADWSYRLPEPSCNALGFSRISTDGTRVKPSLRVLLIEDTEDDAQLLLRELGRSYAVVHKRVMTSTALEETLEQESWDIAICDWTLPQFSAPEALALLLKRDSDLPFII